MTNKEAIKMLTAKLECLTRDVSGMDNDCNRKLCNECHLCYEQGNMGEQKECLRMSIKALELLDKLDEIIVEQIDISNNQVECQTLRWVLDKMSEMS